MPDKDQYKSLMGEIIAKQAVILGPDIAVLKARSVTGIEVADDGTVTDFSGNGGEIVQQLVDTYVDLSGQIVKNALGSIFNKYPGIDKVS